SATICSCSTDSSAMSAPTSQPCMISAPRSAGNSDGPALSRDARVARAAISGHAAGNVRSTLRPIRHAASRCATRGQGAAAPPVRRADAARYAGRDHPRPADMAIRFYSNASAQADIAAACRRCGARTMGKHTEARTCVICSAQLHGHSQETADGWPTNHADHAEQRNDHSADQPKGLTAGPAAEPICEECYREMMVDL